MLRQSHSSDFTNNNRSNNNNSNNNNSHYLSNNNSTYTMHHNNHQQIHEQQQQQIEHDDPLLIAQSLTFVTDDGTVLMSFAAAPFSHLFKITFLLVEILLIFLMVIVSPIDGTHATIISYSIINLIVVAWFWYNSVRSVDVGTDGTLTFWIGNCEIIVPFDKIVAVKTVRARLPCNIVSCGLVPHRGYTSNPAEGVAILTRMPTTPFWTWPRGLEGGRERSCCFGLFQCPRLVIVFSPMGGGDDFVRDIESEMTKWENGGRERDEKRRMQKHTKEGQGGVGGYMDFPPPEIHAS